MRLARLGEDGRAARVGAGLSQRTVAAAIGSSHARIGRFERGDVRNIETDFLGAYLAVVGLELSLRAFPVLDPLRDRAQSAILSRLRAEIHPDLGWRTEVAFPIERDLRAWDAEIQSPSREWLVRVEAEMRVADAQALQRRLMLKMRDGGPGHVALLLADTRHNRAILPTLRAGLGEILPLDSRHVLAALRAGVDPGGSGIVVL
jgi:transcriptional regulator with XRE-family HTH domain